MKENYPEVATVVGKVLLAQVWQHGRHTDGRAVMRRHKTRCTP